MRRASDRAILSSAKPDAIFRLARWLGVPNADGECTCPRCITGVIEACARRMVQS